MQLSLLPLAAAGIVLLGLSTTGAVIEARPFLLRTAEPAERTSALLSAGTRPARVSALESRYARTARLDSCLKVLGDAIISLITSRATVDTLNRECLAIAEAAVAHSPLESNLWLVAARLAANGGDMQRAGRYLNASYRTGPNEQWVAERRAMFAHPLRDRLDPGLRAGIDRDFALLLHTQAGAETLAGLYVAKPEMREYLTSIAQTLDRPLQERFVARVRSVTRAAASNAGRGGLAVD